MGIPPILMKSLLKFRKKKKTTSLIKKELGELSLKKICRNIVKNEEPHPQLILHHNKKYYQVLLMYVPNHKEEIPKTTLGCQVCLF